jgi:hypothetical protein
MQGGHQPTGLRRHARPVPDWMKDNKKVVAFLQKTFPLIGEPCKEGSKYAAHCACQRCKQVYQAGLWMFVINACFLRGKTATDARQDWHEAGGGSLRGPECIRDVIRKIRRAYAGLRQDTGKPLSGKRGRPRKCCHAQGEQSQ